MKTVFRSEEIAHIWANRGAPYGRSPGNLSFDGDAIKSYVTVIGRRITHKGKEAYILDRASFSVSTSKSQGRVCGALPESAKVFHVRIGKRGQSLRFTPAELAAHYEAAAAELAEELPSRYARIRAEQWKAITAQIECARDVLAFFGLGTARLEKKIAARKAGDSRAAEVLLVERAKREAARIAKAARELKERTARNVAEAEEYIAGEFKSLRWVDLSRYGPALETLPPDLRARFVAAVEAGNGRLCDEWRKGVEVSLPNDCPVMLRVETGYTDASEMVTSKGARVPLSDARRTYRFAMLARAKGWHKNGETHKIGAYQLDAVNEQGVVAGCHRVTWAEIERFATAQGWKA